VPLGLADVLVEQLRTLDVEEEALAGLAGLLRHLLGQGVGDRLGDERLAASGRAVQQHALGRAELVLPEQVGVQVGKLDGVPDLLDLPAEAADLLVGDVGDLLEDELLHLRLRDPLVDVVGAGFEQERVAGADRLVEQRGGELDDPLLVRVGDHERAGPIVQQFLEHDDLADVLVAEGLDHIEGLVQHDLLATLERVDVHGGADVHPELAASGEHLDRAVVPGLQKDTEPGRRLCQPVDLLLEGDNLVPGLLQSGDQPLVLARQGGHLGLRLMETLFDDPGLPGGLGQLPAQRGDLLLQEGDLSCEVGDLPFALRGPSLSVVASCHAPSPPSPSRTTTQDPTYLGAVRNLAGQCSCSYIGCSVLDALWTVWSDQH
jgi:hypothetical protein